MPDLDSGLSPTDKSIYMRATTTDTGPQANGARPSFPTWWLSPDIELTGGTSGVDKADPGNNNVRVRFWLNGSLPADANDRVRVHLYVGDPQLVMTPLSNTKQITNVIHVNPMAGANTNQIVWTVPNPPPASGPESSGHKCLIARCFPRNLTADPAAFHQIDDPHVAQRNICIVPCQSPCGVTVLTTNVFKKAETVRLQAVAELEPSEHVLSVVERALSRFPGYERLVTKKPPPFDLLFPDLRDVKILNRSETRAPSGNFGRLKVPNVEAQLTLKPGQTIQMKFLTDLEKSSFGDARIYHMMHTGSDKRVQGGLTLVLVRVKGKRR